MLRSTLYIFIVVVLVFSCSTHYIASNTNNSKTFVRTFEGKEEKIKIDFDRKLFTYFTEIESGNYVANGTLKRQTSNIEFSFPAFSEYKGLPFFLKEFWELKLIDTADYFEVDISIIDLETKKEVNNQASITVSPRNSGTIVHKSNDRSNIYVETKDSIINLIVYRPYIGNDVIKIPQKGKYELLYLKLFKKYC